MVRTAEDCEVEIARLRTQIRNLQWHIQQKDESLRVKNIALDALGWTWCSGACPRGVHRFTDEPVTEEMVLAAEKQAARLREWWTGVHWKIENWPNLPTTQSDWHHRYIDAIKAKIVVRRQYDQVRTEARRCPDRLLPL